MLQAQKENYYDRMPQRIIRSGNYEIFNSVNTMQRECVLLELYSHWQLGKGNIPINSKYSLLVESLPIEVFLTDEGYCAVYEPLAELDYGNSQEIAISNLWLKLEEYYDSLLEREGKLSIALQSELDHIKKFMG